MKSAVLLARTQLAKDNIVTPEYLHVDYRVKNLRRVVIISAALAAALPHMCTDFALAEVAPNTVKVPAPLLESEVSLTERGLSPEAVALADQLKMAPLIEQIEGERRRLSDLGRVQTLESISARQNLIEDRQEALTIIEEARLDIDYALAEIHDEESLYHELLDSYTARRDKQVAVTNEVSFVSNGALWAIGEAFDIPTWKRPKYSIPSGTVSILAGVVPSLASMWAMHIYPGGHYSQEQYPNMLSKIFNYPVTPRIDYPSTVWDYLNAPPSGVKTSKSRIQLLINRWISDKNIPSFTDATSRAQLDIITASKTHGRHMTIDLMAARLTMLNQLSAEILKMNRPLLELMMAVRGEKGLSG